MKKKNVINRALAAKKLYIMPQINVATVKGCGLIMETSIGLPPDMAPKRSADVF